ncbi:MAG: hypothetical protein KJN90_01545 [Gammaproteobacteria bacterium]|nr:hypothetical protein [Gammaproteobacteria bacterium]
MKKFGFIAALIFSLAACAADDNPNGGIATGMLQTRDYIVTMYAGSSGPLYSVRSLDGTVLDRDISIDTMVARYPDLNHLKDNDNIDWAGVDEQLFER